MPNFSHESYQKFADKLNDFLMNPKARPDLQTPEAQEWLNSLRQNYHNPQTDELMPWLTREWKKGRIQAQPTGALFYNMPAGPEGGTTAVPLNPAVLNHWADWYHSNHPTRRGVDIMQLQAPDMHNKINEWDQSMSEQAGGAAASQGQIEKTWPDGWTWQRLTDPNHLKEEGEKMGHCVGGYGDRVAGGHSIIYSLRDQKNEPHVTMEIQPNTFADKETAEVFNERDVDRNRVRSGEVEPLPHYGQVIQIQGKANEQPKPEYQARVKDWVKETFPDEHDRPTWNRQEINDLDDLAYREYHPGDYGLEEPDTIYYWGDILYNAMDPSDNYGGYSVDASDIATAAQEVGEEHELEYALKDWLANAENDFADYFHRDWDHGHLDKEELAEHIGYPPFDKEEWVKDNTEKCDFCDGDGIVREGEDEELCDRCEGIGEIEPNDNAVWEAEDQHYEKMRDQAYYKLWDEDPRNRWAEEISYYLNRARRRPFGRVTHYAPGWMPGNYGKGIVFADGSIHTWSVSKTHDARPTHKEYAFKFASKRLADFWIDPEGSFTLSDHFGFADLIENLDPRLARSVNSDWKIADARDEIEQDRAALRSGEMTDWEFEKKHDWDKYLGSPHSAETEWVPTEELRKFMEFDRRPGGEHSMRSPENWNALSEHIKQHGLNNPVILDYNPETDTAHMSEGNHRTQIALDAGIPALPVRVYRSRRKSDIQIPMNAKPLPEWADPYASGGYHWPQNIKPSHIGLPVVDPPAQNENGWGFSSAVAERFKYDYDLINGKWVKKKKHDDRPDPVPEENPIQFSNDTAGLA